MVAGLKAAGFSGVQDTRLKLNAFMNKLKDKKYQAKLDNISSFETLDFEVFINKYDDEKTFFYLDPPYEDPKNNRLNWYGVKDDSKFGRFSHKRLADLLKTTKSRWALSYYYYDDLEVWFPKDKYTWITKDFFRSSASFSENKELKGTEVLILNYDPNLIVNTTKVSEKLVDEIEEENGGVFIGSVAYQPYYETTEQAQVLNDFATKLISSQKDIEPEIAEIINRPGFFKELLDEEVNKKEDIDDFWK